MKLAFRLLFITVVVLALVLGGCSSPAQSPDKSGQLSSQQTVQPGQSQENPTQAILNNASSSQAGKPQVIRGSGSFDLKQPGTGLVSLNGYAQRLEQQFAGKKDGANYSTSTVITRESVSKLTQQLSTLKTDQDGLPLEVLVASLGSATYFKENPQVSCQGYVLADQVEARLVPDPASLLPHVYGAEQVGEETLNGIAATHYTFDQRALPRFASGKATGEFWVAKEGGWVVKYVLEVDAPKDVLGVGLEGKQTWQYAVTEANTLSKISLPDDCSPVLVDFPASTGAQGLERMSGSMHYFTTEKSDQVASFYRDTLKSKGWEEKEVFEADEKATTLTFMLPINKTTQTVAFIMITPGSDQTEVTVASLEEELPPPPTPTVTP